MRCQSFIKTAEQNYSLHLLTVLIATIVDVAVIVASLRIGTTFWIMFIILGPFLFLPILALLVGLIYVIKDTYRLSSIQKKVFFSWALIALLALPFCLTIRIIQNSQIRDYYELPDNNTMTIWSDYIIFEKYTSFFAPRTNYIKLPGVTSEWELTIDSMGRSAIYVYEKAHQIKPVSPKYPLTATYEGHPGHYWFYADFPADQWMAHYQSYFFADGLFSRTDDKYTVIANDSAYHTDFSFGIDGDTTRYEKKEPLDSLIISFHEDLKRYQSGYYTIDGECKYCFWPDSSQYSIQ